MPNENPKRPDLDLRTVQAQWLASRMRVAPELAALLAELAFANGRAAT